MKNTRVVELSRPELDKLLVQQVCGTLSLPVDPRTKVVYKTSGSTVVVPGTCTIHIPLDKEEEDEYDDCEPEN